QDNVVVHVPHQGRTVIGNNVTLGHGSILEGCVIEDGVVIGMNAVVLQDANIGAASMVAAGSVVGEKARIPPAHLAAGTPARVKKALSGSAQAFTETSASIYRQLAAGYLAGKTRRQDA
ncbi:MAG: gamma carbonic anhydrase family protein, partial [Acidobacteria bacterium]|nr:gamma carbonic anhydrase family protein [Acidobacteriota bacterium]